MKKAIHIQVILKLTNLSVPKTHFPCFTNYQRTARETKNLKSYKHDMYTNTSKQTDAYFTLIEAHTLLKLTTEVEEVVPSTELDIVEFKIIEILFQVLKEHFL